LFIQTEQTPNPSTLKFLPGRVVMGEGMRDFRDADEAGASPLAAEIFSVDGVARVYFGPDFLTVGKTADAALRLTFDLTDGSIARIASVIERERRCCPFLDFVLEIPAAADSVTLTVSGPDGTSELFRTLAAELDRGPATSAG